MREAMALSKFSMTLEVSLDQQQSQKCGIFRTSKRWPDIGDAQ